MKDYILKQLLVDKSSCHFPLWFSDIIDLDFYKNNIHSKITNLINRNSANILILDKIVDNLNLDFSSLFKEIFEIFKGPIVDDVKSDKFIPIL